jgi:peptidyl-prolyl cis-trans isomerase A (cyclophilin A)
MLVISLALLSNITISEKVKVTMYKVFPKSLALVSALSIATLFSALSNATVVEVETSQGNFKVNLHDQTTPKTVENFLKYINDGDYNNTVVHRLVPNFIMQAGGFKFEGTFPLTPIAVDDSVQNEPIYSNVIGTIAMAKKKDSPHSATNEWFINYKDNSANLDLQNGGFTVFGEVIEGMDNINAMANLDICLVVKGWQSRKDVPMPGYTSEQCADSNFVPGIENFVTIHSVTIFDATVETDQNLNSVLSIEKDSDNDGVNDSTDAFPLDPAKYKKDVSTSGSDSGGSLSYFVLCALTLLGFRRKLK